MKEKEPIKKPQGTYMDAGIHTFTHTHIHEHTHTYTCLHRGIP